jgi:hypothetical protein
MADRPGVPISLQLDLEVVQRQRHVGEQVADRGLGGAVDDQFIAGEPDLTLSGAALDDSVAETHHVEPGPAPTTKASTVSRPSNPGHSSLIRFRSSR